MPSNISHGTQVFTKDGAPIEGITRVTVVAAIDEPVRADIELCMIDTTQIEDATPCFLVGQWRDVVALVLRDGKKIDLADNAAMAGTPIDINDIAVGESVTLRNGQTGAVVEICEKVWDGITATLEDRVLAQARIFIHTNGPAYYHTYRRDGVSHSEAGGDIIKIKKAAS